MTDIKVTFRTRQYILVADTYAENGNTCLRLVDEHGAPQLTATVNLRTPLPPEYVYIKDWSENAGIVQALRKLLQPTGGEQATGFVHAKEYVITDIALLDLVSDGHGHGHAGLLATFEAAADPETDDFDDGGEPGLDDGIDLDGDLPAENVAHEEGNNAPAPDEPEREQASSDALAEPSREQPAQDAGASKPWTPPA